LSRSCLGQARISGLSRDIEELVDGEAQQPGHSGLVTTALLTVVAPTAPAQQQGAPPPAATGTDVPTSYFGPPPSQIDRQLVWDINLGRWSPNAVRRGYRSRLIDEFQLLDFVRRGHITGPAGAPYDSVGIRVNCPIVHRFL